jgi:hypothetical protein
MKHLLTLLLLVGCGAPHMVERVDTRPRLILQVKEFGHYLAMFERDSATYAEPLKITDLIVTFGKTQKPHKPSSPIGLCYYETYTMPDMTGKQYRARPKIVIDINFWEKAGRTTRKLLMYHELGHCVLRLGHVNKDDRDSIMNPAILSPSEFKKHERYYLEDLFNQ